MIRNYFKNRSFKFFAIAWLSLVLSSCAVPVRHPSDEGPVSYDSQPAVVALLSDAERERNAGDSDKAAAALERALSIDPSDAMAWHQLAKLRLQQGAVGEAISLANKSIQLAQDASALRRVNWRLIADAYDKQGDSSKARQARRRSMELN